MVAGWSACAAKASLISKTSICSSESPAASRAAGMVRVKVRVRVRVRVRDS